MAAVFDGKANAESIARIVACGKEPSSTSHVAPQASAPMQSITEVRAFTGRGVETGSMSSSEFSFIPKTSSYGGRESRRSRS